MTQIIKTVHRSVPEIVDVAKAKSIRSFRRWNANRKRGLDRDFPDAIANFVAFNKKHGIGDANGFGVGLDKKRIFLKQRPGSARPVTLPSLKFLGEE